VTEAAAAKQEVVRVDDAPKSAPSKRRLVPKLKSISGDVMVNVFVEMKPLGHSTADAFRRT